MTVKQAYTAALILSEGRYEKKTRYLKGLEDAEKEIQVEEVIRTEWTRVSDRVIKRTKKQTEVK